MLARRAVRAAHREMFSHAADRASGSRTRPVRQPDGVGNQARLRHLHAQHSPDKPKPSPAAPTAPAAGVDVWGFAVDRSMCGCKAFVRESIDWANEAGSTYRACDTPANADGDAVEACFKKAHPTAVVVASTDAGGKMTLPPPSHDPCQRIGAKSTLVHETMHTRRTDDLARAQGPAFLAAWNAASGAKDKLEALRPKFPKEVAAFEAQRSGASEWAQDEVRAYLWQRRFLQDALSALNGMC